MTETSTYANVTLDPRANVYFDGKCVFTRSISPTAPASRPA